MTVVANVVINGVEYAVCQNTWGDEFGVPFRGIPGGFFLVPMTGIYHLLGLRGNLAGDVLAFTELGVAPTNGTIPVTDLKNWANSKHFLISRNQLLKFADTYQ